MKDFSPRQAIPALETPRFVFVSAKRRDVGVDLILRPSDPAGPLCATSSPKSYAHTPLLDSEGLPDGRVIRITKEGLQELYGILQRMGNRSEIEATYSDIRAWVLNNNSGKLVVAMSHMHYGIKDAMNKCGVLNPVDPVSQFSNVFDQILD